MPIHPKAKANEPPSTPRREGKIGQESRGISLGQQRVRELERLTDALRVLFEEKEIGEWFDAPNPALGGLKPIEVIERGETDRLWQMIFELKAGIHL